MKCSTFRTGYCLISCYALEPLKCTCPCSGLKYINTFIDKISFCTYTFEKLYIRNNPSPWFVPLYIATVRNQSWRSWHQCIDRSIDDGADLHPTPPGGSSVHDISAMHRSKKAQDETRCDTAFNPLLALLSVMHLDFSEPSPDSTSVSLYC